MKLREKLILSFVLVAVVTAASVVVVFRWGSVQEVQSFMMRGSMVEIDALATSLEDYYAQTGGWEGAVMLLPESGRGMGNGMMGGQRLRVADAGGLVMADTRGATGDRLSLAERAAAIILHDARGGTAGYLLAEGGMAGGGATSSVLLERLLRSSLIGAGVGVGLALLAGLFLSWQLLKPVGQLTRAAGQMAQGDLNQRVRAQAGDELSTLGQAFNQMAASLEQAQHNRRAMTADIAHELRTPIAVQRAHLEALQDGVYALTPENLQPVIDQTDLLARLVEDLRTLALADAGELDLQREPVDLRALAAALVERFRPEAEHREIALVYEPPDGSQALPLRLDPRRIEQVLNNLMSNALRHTPAGGSVRVSVARDRQNCFVVVRDSGDGIPAEALAHLFERFYRADRSRSRQEGGTGLGLAIARQLALAHGGDLTARNHPEGGAEFSLRLPAQER